MPFQRLASWYEKYERWISSLSLISGFIFDAVALKRVDLFIENFWIVVHLLMAAIGIIALNLFEKGRARRDISETTRARVHFWLIIFIQFAFGGLLSTFLVFYFRSATFAQSWPFLLLLAIAFASNEIFKKHYIRLVFQISVLFLAIYAFAIFLIPVLVHSMSRTIFLVSGLVSLVTISIFLFLLWLITREHFRKSWMLIVGSITGLFILINILYFTNLIPPIPLALKDSGVYHNITRNSDGSYSGSAEPTNWLSFFHSYDPMYIIQGDPVYVYTAVFSPTHFNTQIIHEWQYYDPSTKKWVTESTIMLSIVGGRDAGFRTYSMKQFLSEGKWRVNVKTTQGQLIGRQTFSIVYSQSEPQQSSVILQ